MNAQWQQQTIGHLCSILFHPDYTVGYGIAPYRAFRLADFTAGGESHPASKIIVLFFLLIAL